MVRMRELNHASVWGASARALDANTHKALEIRRQDANIHKTLTMKRQDAFITQYLCNKISRGQLNDQHGIMQYYDTKSH